MSKATYKDAGVDLEVYEESMSRLPRLLRRTHSPRVIGAEGGFAGLFQLDFPGALFSRNYEDPVLVSCTDGVGTKLKVAQNADSHESVGVDLVAMCANDMICCGAEPLFFLDYIAMAKDDPALLEQIVSGVSRGCVECDLALVGGETAIMPDIYQPGDYDMAGFCVGVVERKRLIDGKAIAPGDVVLGLAASGIHSNGYSLVRKIVFEIAGHDPEDFVEELDTTVGLALLEPTRLYVREVRKILTHYRVKNVVHGVAHITGGGLLENLSRILPEGVRAKITPDSWPVPPVFPWLQKLGEVESDEMARVFNMGVGLTMVVSPYYAESIQQQLAQDGIESWPIGVIEEGERGADWA